MATLPACVQALGEADVLSLATVRADGRPHVVPVWFHWDGEAISVFSKAEAQKVLNLLADPRAMVAFGAPGLGQGAGLLEVVAELGPTAANRLSAGFGRKYRDRLDRLGVTLDDFVATYPMLIRLRPTRWLDWGGPGWTAASKIRLTNESRSGCSRDGWPEHGSRGPQRSRNTPRATSQIDQTT